MQILGFTAPICNTEGNFPFTAFFDSYFSFSASRYRVIEACTIDDKNGYRVERHEIKQSTPLNFLKALSYATVVIPIIMAIGKLIARSKYSFFIEKILPPIQEEVQKRTQEFQELKNKALTSLNQPTRTPLVPQWTLTQEQEKDLINADDKKYEHSSKLPKGVKVVRGGCHEVLFLDSIPGFVFKPIEDQKQVSKYINIANKARQFVIQNNLNLLYIPESQEIKINDHYFVMQEKANLISGNYYEQKGIYASYWKDDEMTDYMKELFSQLALLIAKTDFGDVKYDNIPFTEDGQIALIDLDERSPIMGMTAGGVAGKHYGLLNYIPKEHLSDFLDIARNQLGNKYHQQLEDEIAAIEARAEKKENKEREYEEFVEKSFISSSSQIINSQLPTIFYDIRKQKLAQYIIEEANQQLSSSKSFSVQEGRKIILGINSNDSLFQKALKIWWPYLTVSSFFYPFTHFILDDVLKELKDAGYIHKYQVYPVRNYVKIRC